MGGKESLDTKKPWTITAEGFQKLYMKLQMNASMINSSQSQKLRWLLYAARAKGVEDGIRSLLGFLRSAFLHFFLRLWERYCFVLCLGLRLIRHVPFAKFIKDALLVHFRVILQRGVARGVSNNGGDDLNTYLLLVQLANVGFPSYVRSEHLVQLADVLYFLQVGVVLLVGE